MQIDVEHALHSVSNDNLVHPAISLEEYRVVQKQVKDLEEEIGNLNRELRGLKLEKRAMTIEDIKHDDSKVYSNTKL